MAQVARVVKKISEDKYTTDDDRYKEFRPWSELAHAVISMACADYAAIHHGSYDLEKQRRRNEAKRFFCSKWYMHIDIAGKFDPYIIMDLIDTHKPNPRSFAQNTARGKMQGDKDEM